jgi:hypothetical protein
LKWVRQQYPRVFGRKCLKKGWFCETGEAVTGVVRE